MLTRRDRNVHIPSVQAVEEAIGMAAHKWKYKCHEIACKMLEAKLVYGTECYGHYYGPVADEYPRKGLPFHRHGWISTRRYFVIDPTRWVFEMVEPYIYYGDNDDYDPGGQRLAASRAGAYPDELRDSPHLTPSQRELHSKIIQLDVGDAARPRLAELTGGQEVDFNIDQVFWLANLPVSWWGEDAPAIYKAIDRAGYKAAIPLDFWRMGMSQPVASNLP